MDDDHDKDAVAIGKCDSEARFVSDMEASSSKNITRIKAPKQRPDSLQIELLTSIHEESVRNSHVYNSNYVHLGFRKLSYSVRHGLFLNSKCFSIINKFSRAREMFRWTFLFTKTSNYQLFSVVSIRCLFKVFAPCTCVHEQRFRCEGIRLASTCFGVLRPHCCCFFDRVCVSFKVAHYKKNN